MHHHELAQSLLGILGVSSWLELGRHALWAAGGGIVALGGTYITMMRSISRIEGVISTWTDHGDRVERLEGEVVSIRSAMARAGIEIMATSNHRRSRVPRDIR